MQRGTRMPFRVVLLSSFGLAIKRKMQASCCSYIGNHSPQPKNINTLLMFPDGPGFRDPL